MHAHKPHTHTSVTSPVQMRDERQALDDLGDRLVMALLTFLVLLNEQRKELAQLSLLLLNAHYQLLSASLCFLAFETLRVMPYGRKLFNAPNMWNAPFIDVVEKMMLHKPRQFYHNFRMTPTTFESLFHRVQNHMYPPERAKRTRERDPAVTRKRLLWTIYFLAHGGSYRNLSNVWGTPLCYKELLIDELAAMKSKVHCMHVALGRPCARHNVQVHVPSGSIRSSAFRLCDGRRAPLLKRSSYPVWK